jgi:hypothetical protein
MGGLHKRNNTTIHQMCERHNGIRNSKKYVAVYSLYMDHLPMRSQQRKWCEEGTKSVCLFYYNVRRVEMP